MKKILFLILMLPIIVTSCYTTQSISLENDFNKTYIGTNRAEIKSIFGNPDRVVNDKDTGEILIYEYFTTETDSCASAKSHSSRDSVYGDTTSYTNRNYVEFYFDQDRCYKVNTNERENVRKLNKGKTAACVITAIVAPIVAINALAAKFILYYLLLYY